MRRGISLVLVVLFAAQVTGAQQASRYDIQLETQRARLAAAEQNLPRYMTVGWFASVGFLVSLGALIAGPIMWYRGHDSGDSSLRDAGMITTGVSAFLTLPLSVRMSLFAQSGARRSVVDQQRFPRIIAATEQALIAREYGSPVMIRHLAQDASTGDSATGTPVRLHLENVSDELLREVRLWFSPSVSIVLPDELTPGERFWETIVLPPVEADAPAEVSIVAIEVVRADGSVWREDDPDTISNTLTVGRSQ
jgi:hypothetical protein